jgi:hypothetical protein
MLPPMPRPGQPHAPLGPPSLSFMPDRGGQAGYVLSGIARDSSGAPLANATIDLFYATGDKARYASTTADATGAFSFFGGDNVSTFFVVAYLDGGTPVAGTTLQSLKFT